MTFMKVFLPCWLVFTIFVLWDNVKTHARTTPLAAMVVALSITVTYYVWSRP